MVPLLCLQEHTQKLKVLRGNQKHFQQEPKKINYTNADIDQNHGDSPGLASKLKTSLQYLKGLNIKGILQGDLLFTEGDISTTSLDGEDHITIKNQHHTYAVPKDSKLAKQMLSAKIGVVWHTKYTGRDMENMKASFGPSVRSLTKTKNVWFTDADFRDVHGSANFTARAK